MPLVLIGRPRGSPGSRGLPVLQEYGWVDISVWCMQRDESHNMSRSFPWSSRQPVKMYVLIACRSAVLLVGVPGGCKKHIHQ